jgi:hypothetical protein
VIQGVVGELFGLPGREGLPHYLNCAEIEGMYPANSIEPHNGETNLESIYDQRDTLGSRR